MSPAHGLVCQPIDRRPGKIDPGSLQVMKQIELKTRSPREILGGVPPFEQFEDEEEPELFPETDAAAVSGTVTISPRGGGLFAGADADEAVIIHGNAADLVLQALLDRFDSPPSAEQQAVLDAVTAIAAEESSPILRARTSVTQGFIIDALTVADADDVEHTIEELVAFHDMEAAGTLDTVARKAHQAMYVQLRKQIRKASLTSKAAAAEAALERTPEPRECALCYREWHDGDNIVCLQCFHAFCDVCEGDARGISIQSWLAEHGTCPTCLNANAVGEILVGPYVTPLQQQARASATEAAALWQPPTFYSCAMCDPDGDEETPVWQGLLCREPEPPARGEGAAHGLPQIHFTCDLCLVKQVKWISGGELATLQKSKGLIVCTLCEDGDAEPYSHEELARHLRSDPDAFKMLIDGQKRLIEIDSEHNADQRVRDQLKKLVEMDEVERKVLNARRHIGTSLNNRACPPVTQSKYALTNYALSPDVQSRS